MLLPETCTWVSPSVPYCILPPDATACWQFPLPSKSPWGLHVGGALKWLWKALATLDTLFETISGHTSFEYLSFPVALLKLYFKIS